ncbi:hypothetical protein Pmani_032845 [Petrolisthes manimaculis]|uniref:Secreted protein n=1 Tax=Petrolisthes manimaculis TaxID=1843537 RepID=A0AAE1NQY5_9EUCA|nr:hypothetical protein Pmani_032845 [Petrolisthes manimaculis]
MGVVVVVVVVVVVRGNLARRSLIPEACVRPKYTCDLAFSGVKSHTRNNNNNTTERRPTWMARPNSAAQFYTIQR